MIVEFEGLLGKPGERNVFVNLNNVTHVRKIDDNVLKISFNSINNRSESHNIEVVCTLEEFRKLSIKK